MAASTVSVMDKLLKNVYNPTWQTAFKEEYIGYKIASSEKRDFVGRKEIFPIEYGRGNGVGFRAEKGAGSGTYNTAYGFPDPGGPLVENGEVDIRRMYSTLQWTHDAIERTKNDKGAFKRLLDLEFKSKYSRMLFEAELATYGDGSQARATVASANVTITTGADGDVTFDTTRFLVRGDQIVFWNGTALRANGGGDAASLGLVTVKAVKSPTVATITNGCANSVVCTVGDVVRNLGDRFLNNATVTDNAFVGLGAAVDDGTGTEIYCGISRTGSTGGYPYLPEWASKVIDCGGAPVDEDLLIKGLDAIKRVSNEDIDTIIWDVSIRRDFVKITRPDRRYAPVTQLDPGYAEEALVLTAGNKKVKLMEDVWAPFGIAYGLPRGNLKFYELTALGLDDSTGSVLKMGTPYGVAGTGDVFYAFMRWKGNFVLERPYAAIKWKNLQALAE